MILRVIPNSLYESLNENKLLQKEFPSCDKDCIETLIQEVPKTLKPKARAILELIQEDDTLGWNTITREVTIGQETLHGSDIVKLIHALVLQSQKFLYLKGADQFAESLLKSSVPSHLYQIPNYHPQITPAKQTNSKHSWIRFEDKFTLNG